jgi:hypothetical protein
MNEFLKKLSKPADFISYYYEELKKNALYKNILLSRHGFVGFFIELMANTQWSLKYYYDKLFVESFPFTATKNNNLRYHANLYNYKLKGAIPSKVIGNFEINIDALPLPSLAVKRREIDIKLVGNEITLNSLPFTLNSKYKLVCDKISPGQWSYRAEISTNDKKRIISFNEYNNNIEIIDCEQYRVDKISFTAINYVRGSFFKKPILELLENEFIYKVEARVKYYDSQTYEIFDISNTKDFYSSDDNVIFYSITPDNMVHIELGKGIKGKYIPLSTVEVTVYITTGTNGNFKILESSKFDGKLVIFDYDENNLPLTSESKSTNIKNVISVNLKETRYGMDEDRGEILRNNLMKFIQTRENLITETDFYNLFNKVSDGVEIIFKKTSFERNNFFIYMLLSDRLNSPVYSLTDTISLEDFTKNEMVNLNNEKYVYYPSKIINGKEFISPFLYKYNNLLNIYQG